jgi:hypothetical protein
MEKETSLQLMTRKINVLNTCDHCDLLENYHVVCGMMTIGYASGVILQDDYDAVSKEITAILSKRFIRHNIIGLCD